MKVIVEGPRGANLMALAAETAEDQAKILTFAPVDYFTRTAKTWKIRSDVVIICNDSGTPVEMIIHKL